ERIVRLRAQDCHKSYRSNYSAGTKEGNALKILEPPGHGYFTVNHCVHAINRGRASWSCVAKWPCHNARRKRAQQKAGCNNAPPAKKATPAKQKVSWYPENNDVCSGKRETGYQDALRSHPDIRIFRREDPELIA